MDMRSNLLSSLRLIPFVPGSLIGMAGMARFLYNGGMTADRKKPITGKDLEALIERDKEAVASLACEGIVFTPEEDAAFAEMNKLGLSYDDRIKYLNQYFDNTSRPPQNNPE